MTAWHGNTFRISGTMWGESTGEFPSQRSVIRIFSSVSLIRCWIISRVAGVLSSHDAAICRHWNDPMGCWLLPFFQFCLTQCACCVICPIYVKSWSPLQWRHNERDGVSNHQPYDCLLMRLFRQRSKKTSKLRVTGFVRGIHRWPVNSPHKGPVTRKMFPFDDIFMAFGEHDECW